MTSTQSLSHLDSPKIWGKKLTYIKNILFRNTDVKVSRESVACLSAQVLGEQKQLDSASTRQAWTHSESQNRQRYIVRTYLKKKK